MATVMMPSSYRSTGSIDVPRHSSEQPLFILAVALAIPLWVLILVSIVGAVYALFVGVFFLCAHALFVYHVRANGVRVGPAQFPELYARVRQLAQQMGMEDVPATYVMQAGGVLNAFATKFLGSNMMVLYSDLLEACGDNDLARDMIVGHELGHIRAGHLKWRWLIAPALMIPFLGGALSRAREYTCDRFGFVASTDPQSAELGLIILAAGGRLARDVNRSAFLDQQRELSGFWMGLANLFASHPALTRRVAALREFRA